jgi:hypothetical protein
MASFGKKLAAALFEVADRGPSAPEQTNDTVPVDPMRTTTPTAATDTRFTGHFDKLMGDANIPGPDYFEFARMIAAMQAITDEAARYNAAFAGLQAQGLTRQRLLDTATDYLRVLTTDAQQFQATVDNSFQEKVKGKETEAEGKAARIQTLSQEIAQLQQQIGALQEETRASKEKLAAGSSAYTAESNRRQQEIRRDVEKINRFIH